MTKEEYYLNIAAVVASKSKCLRKQYGTVIVKDDEIVSTGYNGNCRGEAECTVCTKIEINKDEAEYLTCPAVHSEQNALLSAARHEMIGSTLYLAGINAETGEEINAYPCEICLRLIKNAGINRVINKTGIIYERNENGILERKF